MIISGKELSTKLKTEMAGQVATFPEKYGRVPHLVVILVGDDPASVSYVTGKAKASEVVGIRNTTIRKPETVTEDELLSLIRQLNEDDSVGEGCGWVPSSQCRGPLAEAALHCRLHSERDNQAAESRRCHDTGQEGCRDRPQQHSRASGIETAAG